MIRNRMVVACSLILLLIVGCGQSISQEISEAVVEQVSGAENVELNEEDGSISFSATDADGNEVSYSVEEDQQLTAIEGFGLSLPLPAGTVTNGVQRVNNGEGGVVTVSAMLDGVSIEAFVTEMNETLEANGFVSEGDWQMTDNQEGSQFTAVSYLHPDGYQFSLLGGADGLVLSLVKE